MGANPLSSNVVTDLSCPKQFSTRFRHDKSVSLPNDKFRRFYCTFSNGVIKQILTKSAMLLREMTGKVRIRKKRLFLRTDGDCAREIPPAYNEFSCIFKPYTLTKYYCFTLLTARRGF